MAEILLVEKEPQRLRLWRGCLEKAGHTVMAAATIDEARDRLKASAPDITIMNARLPWAESFPFLRLLEDKSCPLLFIAADVGNRAHLEALYNGSCRVLVSPFAGKALVSAVEALLQESQERLSCGSLQLNRVHKQVLMNGQPLSLTAQEFALLQALMESPDTALTREQRLRTAWGYQGIGETRTVDVHVQRLRKKLGCDRIETVYKLGYRLRMA